MIKSINNNQDNILNDIYTLYTDGKVPECDITYSKGNFYKNTAKPEYKYDKHPKNKDIKPLDDFFNTNKKFNSIMCDLPFIISYGKNGNIIRDRFSGYKTLDELKTSYKTILEECYKKLNDNAILIFKCQDTKLHTQHQFWTHQYTMNMAENIGYEIIDLFILLAKNRLPNRGKLQHSARKYHSYFLIMRKNK